MINLLLELSMNTYTTEGILASLGYSDPLDAARQQARMVLLGRLARYQAILHQFEVKRGCTLEELRQDYQVVGNEDFSADNDYLEWQWYADAAQTTQTQLEAILEYKTR